MKDTIYFDMDGTIVDFYSVPNWLQSLEKSQTKPYRIAKPIQKNYDLVKKAILKGYKIGVISWGSKNCDDFFYKKLPPQNCNGWRDTSHLLLKFILFHMEQIKKVSPRIKMDG